MENTIDELIEMLLALASDACPVEVSVYKDDDTAIYTVSIGPEYSDHNPDGYDLFLQTENKEEHKFNIVEAIAFLSAKIKAKERNVPPPPVRPDNLK